MNKASKSLNANEIRQGDVILRRVDSIPEGAKLINSKEKILQDSETQGKFHRFHPTADVKMFQTRDIAPVDGSITPDLGKFIMVNRDSTLFHGRGFNAEPSVEHQVDHHALTIPVGTYQVVIKREFDHESRVVRNVVD